MKRSTGLHLSVSALLLVIAVAPFAEAGTYGSERRQDRRSDR